MKSKHTMKLCILYNEIMGYNLHVIKELSKYFEQVRIYEFRSNFNRSFSRDDLPKNIEFINSAGLTTQTLLNALGDFDPDLVYVGGWSNLSYNFAAFSMRQQNKKVVLGLDGQWHGTAKQILGSFLFKFGLRRILYSQVWVAGSRQHEFARHLGFQNNQILFNLYCADETYRISRKDTKPNFAKRFIYVGRAEKVKNVSLLLEAFAAINSDWELYLIGSEKLRELAKDYGKVKVFGFLPPEKIRDIYVEGGVFVLPSKFEPWGVVVHEAAKAGLPLLCSDSVGAADEFLIDGLNGYVFISDDSLSLQSKLLKFIKLSSEELSKMGAMSNKLSGKITLTTSVHSLMAAISPNDKI